MNGYEILLGFFISPLAQPWLVLSAVRSKKISGLVFKENYIPHVFQIVVDLLAHNYLCSLNICSLWTWFEANSGNTMMAPAGPMEELQVATSERRQLPSLLLANSERRFLPSFLASLLPSFLPSFLACLPVSLPQLQVSLPCICLF